MANHLRSQKNVMNKNKNIYTRKKGLLVSLSLLLWCNIFFPFLQKKKLRTVNVCPLTEQVFIKKCSRSEDVKRIIGINFHVFICACVFSDYQLRTNS